MQELQETFNSLDSLLKDEKTFAEVVSAVFVSIDKDNNGTLDLEEVGNFISGVCKDMGVKKDISKGNVMDIFEELDEDKSKTISKDELAKFLRALFEEQKNQIFKRLKKS